MQTLFRAPPYIHPTPATIEPQRTPKTAMAINLAKDPSCNPGMGVPLFGFSRRFKRTECSNGFSWVLLLDRGRMVGGTWCYSSNGDVGCVEKVESDVYMVRDSGWGVRRMVEDGGEMRNVAYIQADAFHEPVALFDDFFFKFFQAEVLSALLYRIKNSPPDRYACLVAEPLDATNPMQMGPLVGVVDITVQREGDVLTYLDEEEYLYVSGIAVLKNYRRMKVGSTLLKACEAISRTWGFKYLVLRAYEDDLAALRLYTKQGYRIVTADPKWMTTWIGRRRRVLMVKSTQLEFPV